jgi:hypothetical protein
VSEPTTGPIRHLLGALPRTLRVLGWIVLGYAVVTVLVFVPVLAGTFFPSTPAHAAVTFSALRAGPVYVAPGARKWVDLTAADRAIGNRPIVVAMYDQALPGDTDDDYDVCRSIAREFGEVLVVLLQPNLQPYACVGANWPTARIPVGEQTFGLDPASVWANNLGADIATSTWLATADGQQTPLISELAAEYDIAARTQLASPPPPRVLHEQYRTLKIAGWLALVVVVVLGLFLGLRRLGLRAIAAQQRRDQAAGLRAATQAKIYELAETVRTGRGARSDVGLAEASQRYLEVLTRLEAARSETDLREVKALVDKAESLLTQAG